MKILIVAAALAACGVDAAERAAPPVADHAVDGLEVRVDTPGRALVLTSRDTAGVYVHVLEQRLAALADWVPCRDPAACPPLPPGGGMRMAFDSIPGYRADAHDVIVYWWTLERVAGGAYEPRGMRSRVVPIAAAGR